MHGFLNILKPPGMTSFDVVASVRRALRTKKVGHLGTLDPGASGVLPLACGRATRLIEYVTSDPKVYRAEILLGTSTDTQDTFGTVLAQRPWHDVTRERFLEALSSFEGDIMQKPPLYSAVHHEGERLYKLARKGVEVDVKARPVRIHSVRLLDFDAPRALVEVVCGGGTYVRTLCADLGDLLGCGGTLSFLVRTTSGPFHIDDAVLLEELRGTSSCAPLLPLDWPLGAVRSVILDDKMECAWRNGVKIHSNKFTMEAGPQTPGIFRIYSPLKEFLGIGEIVPDNPLCLVPLKVLSGGDEQ